MQDDTKQIQEVMMSLFDEEQIMKSFIKSERYEAAQENAKETAKRIIKKVKCHLKKLQTIFLYYHLKN